MVMDLFSKIPTATLHILLVIFIVSAVNGQFYDIQKSLNQLRDDLDRHSELDEESYEKIAEVFHELQHDGASVLQQGLDSVKYDISQTCTDQTLHLLDNIGSLWSLYLFDSWGKLEPGVLEGNMKWNGEFNECLNVSDGNQFTTRYCTASITIKINGSAIPFSPAFGVCVPRGCNKDDVIGFIATVVPEFSVGAYCHEVMSERTFPSSSVAALVFILIFVAICLLATLYEGLCQILESYNSASSNRHKQQSIDENTPLLGEPRKATPVSPSLTVRTSLAFSMYSNAKKVLDTTQPPGTITCINGIRFFSMSWVILGHFLITYVISNMKNQMYIVDFEKRWTSQVLLNATVSVDSFFVLSGLLVSYLFLKDFNRRNIGFSSFLKALPMVYLQRYIRLTPAYVFTILINTCLLYYLWDGPNWPKSDQSTFDPHCSDNWYLNVLYVNNIFKVNEQCTAWGWYLANDFQFFLVAPFIVFIFFINEIIGFIIGALAILGSVASAIAVADQQNAGLMFPTTQSRYSFKANAMGMNEQLPYYFVPWTRYQSYGVGIVAGLILYRMKQRNIKIPTVANLILWGISAGLLLSVVYGPYDASIGGHVITLGEADAYNGISRTAWSMGLSYVIIACALGQGGWINEFLSWEGFVPVSRLTYSAYMIHIPILLLLSYSSRSTQIYTDITLAKEYIFVLTAVMFLAFPFSLIFEVPFVNLDKIFLSRFSIKKDRSKSSTVGSSHDELHQNKQASKPVNHDNSPFTVKTDNS